MQPSTAGAGFFVDVGLGVGLGVGVGVVVGEVVGVGVGVGVGPGLIVNCTSAELLACVPEISVKTIDPFHVPAGMPLIVNAQLPLDDLTALCIGVRLRPLSGAATNFTVPVTTGVPVGRFTST